MEKMIIKNKRLKMSPGGVITLNVAARKTLGMKVNEPGKVSVSTLRDCVIIANDDSQKNAARISKSGQMILENDAREFLMKSEKRHYWLQLNDSAKEVRLMPF